MASFIANITDKSLRIGVKKGVKCPGGGYIFTDAEPCFVEPMSTLEIGNGTIDPIIMQQYPDAERVVELWVEGYEDSKAIVILAPAGRTFQAFTTAFFRTAVMSIYCVEYIPGTQNVPMQFLMAISAHNNRY